MLLKKDNEFILHHLKGKMTKETKAIFNKEISDTFLKNPIDAINELTSTYPENQEIKKLEDAFNHIYDFNTDEYKKKRIDIDMLYKDENWNRISEQVNEPLEEKPDENLRDTIQYKLVDNLTTLSEWLLKWISVEEKEMPSIKGKELATINWATLLENIGTHPDAIWYHELANILLENFKTKLERTEIRLVIRDDKNDLFQKWWDISLKARSAEDYININALTTIWLWPLAHYKHTEMMFMECVLHEIIHLITWSFVAWKRNTAINASLLEILTIHLPKIIVKALKNDKVIWPKLLKFSDDTENKKGVLKEFFTLYHKLAEHKKEYWFYSLPEFIAVLCTNWRFQEIIKNYDNGKTYQKIKEILHNELWTDILIDLKAAQDTYLEYNQHIDDIIKLRKALQIS